MALLANRATRATTKQYWKYGARLSDGWLFGRRVDVTDAQYHLFRSHLPLLVALAAIHLSLSHLFRLFASRRASHSPSSPTYSPLAARTTRARFIAFFALVLLAALHGASLPKLLVILFVNYRVALLGAPGSAAEARGWKRAWTPFATWTFNIAVLFGNELCHGYRYGALHPSLSWLDEYGGLLPRWHISWNISMLRLVSFNMEYYWAWGAQRAALGEGEVLLETPTSPMEKASARTRPSRPPGPDPSPSAGNYTFTLFLAYVLYPPLYLAGPIMTYPSFLSQLAPSPSPTSALPSPAAVELPNPLAAPPLAPTYREADELRPRALLAYAARFAACLLTMELVLHFMYVVALKDSGKGWWDGLSAAEVSMVGFWNLIVVWLKLLLPWRLFRLWALCDGIVPPENMVRCMANNYSTLGFWRSWHRSYNLWVIRYLYIPLGGAARPLLATLGVFTFVALWHDLRLRLLIWGWGVTLFVVPEMLARKLVPYSRFGTKPWYRHLAALGGVANVLLMMTANLIGFVVGVDGAKELWRVMLGDWEGRLFLLFASGCLFVAVQVMFEYREEERRRGISRKC
ncbi:glycerol transporter [Rhodotorula kratochvilovae]